MNRKKLIFICLVLILLIAGIVTFTFRPRNQGLYKVTILPSLGGDFTFPTSIDDKGQIAGYSEVSKGNIHFFLWDKENGIKDLGSVEEGNISINNAGQIVASMTDPNGNKRSFVWDANSGKTILPTLGGKNCFAQSINNLGKVVGYSQTASGVEHPFIWDAVNGIRDLTPNSTTQMIPLSINDAGQIVFIASSGVMLFAKMKEDKIIQLVPVPFPGRCNINNNGYLAGKAQTSQDKYYMAIWHPDYGQYNSGKMTSSSTFLINDLNQVTISEDREYIGTLAKILPHPQRKHYLVDPNFGTISLDDYISVKRNENLCLKDINNSGWIIGAVQSTTDPNSKGILFEPIPEKMEQIPKKQIKRENKVLE